MKLRHEDFEIIKRYLLYDRKLRNTPHDVNTMKSRYRVLCNYFEDKEFNRDTFISFMEYMQQKGYSNAYCNIMITMAKHIDKYYKLKQLEDFTLYPKTQKLVDVLTAEEMIALAEQPLPYTRLAEEKNTIMRAVVYTLFYTGARINEVLYLRWEDIRESPIPLLVFNQTKINELRYAPIPKTLYDDLTALPHLSGYIFVRHDGEPLHDTTVGLALKKKADLIGLKKRVYNHLFRHSFINIMLRGGAKIHEVSRLVGHKSIETTNQHYVHVMIEELNDVLNAYHPALKKSQTIDSLAKRIREMCGNILDTDRFDLRVKREKKSVSFEIKELDS